MDTPHVVEAPTDTPPGIAVDLREDGLLWLINAAVFHPRGFALAMHPDNPGEFRLLGDGAEAWRFANDDTTDIKFAAVEAMFARAALATVGEIDG